MLNPNEKYYLHSFVCDTVIDNYENGEDGTVSFWTDRDINFEYEHGFDTIEELLMAICNINSFDYIKENWDCGYSHGCFEASYFLNKNNKKPSDEEIKRWKNGEIKLYTCHISVNVEVHSAPRALTQDEFENWS